MEIDKKEIQLRLNQSMSKDTVYRTLWFLKDLGLVTTLCPHHNQFRFDANMKPHHHYICTNCGLVRDFYNEDFNQFKIPDEAVKLGTVESRHVELRGICHQCSQNVIQN